MTFEQIKQIVGSHYGYTVAELDSPSRKRRLARARQMAMMVCRTETGASFPAIGAAFGNRDHTTVIHAVTTMKAKMKNPDPGYDYAADHSAIRLRIWRLQRAIDEMQMALN